MANARTETKDRKQLATARPSVGAASEVKPQAFGRIADPALRRGFTIVELLIVIVVIAILATVATFSFRAIQASNRDSQREADTLLISEALETYYQRYGEYPACADLTETPEIIAQQTLIGIQPEALRAPQAKDAIKNSIVCDDITESDGDDVYAYVGGVNGCELKYRSEGNGIVTVPCRHAPTAPTIATAENCFEFSNGAITDYYRNEGGNSANPVCPRDVVIPARISGVSVKTIGEYAFYRDELTSIAIPDSVTKIESSAFQYNLLTSLTIPDSLTSTGYSAFSDNKLTSVTIPDSVRVIEDYAFRANKLTSITMPESVISIGTYAFGFNELTSVTIPNSVRTIATSAFYANKMTSVTIPDSVTSVGYSAFWSNPLSNASVKTGTNLTGGAVGVFPSNAHVTWR